MWITFNLWTSLNIILIHLLLWIVELEQKVSDLPQMIDLPLISRARCQTAYEQVGVGNICAGGQRGKGICSGDSGGPFQCFLGGQWVYVGLDSYTALCALPDYPSVFTKVYNYVDWLQNTIARNARGRTFSFNWLLLSLNFDYLLQN